MEVDMTLKFTSQAAWLSDVDKLEPDCAVGFFAKDVSAWPDIKTAFEMQFKGRGDLECWHHGEWVCARRSSKAG
jgi:hypothetical protein